MRILKLFRFKGGHRSPDWVFLGALAILLVFGIFMLASASFDLGKIRFNDAFYYLRHQIFSGLLIGAVGFAIGYFINYKFWEKAAPYILGLGIVLLALVFTPFGVNHFGATRWLQIGPLLLQPAEIMKLAFVVYLASWLSSKKRSRARRMSFMEGYVPFLALCGIVAALIFPQPALTTLIIIILAGFAQYFVSGAKLSFVGGTVILGIIIIACFIAFVPYRMARINTFLNHALNKPTVSEGDNYHFNTAITVLRNGGLLGLGFGNSTAKYKSLPEPIGDSIFAVIGEELGFVGIFSLVCVYILFLMRGYLIAWRTREQFGKLLAVGFITVFAAQAFINIAAVSGVIPLTGVPLPFISYGGTSLAIFLTMSGIIANISKYASREI